MENIDYTEKIANFNLLVGNQNEEIALNYLTITNWDEDKAAILYNKENKGADAKLSTTRNKYSNSDFDHQYNTVNYNNFLDYNNIIPNSPFLTERTPAPKNILSNSYLNSEVTSKINKYREVKIYHETLFKKFKGIFAKDNRSYYPTWEKKCKNCYKLYDTFISNLSTNTGIIIFYNERSANEALTNFDIINKNENLKKLFFQRTAIYPLINNSKEGKHLIKYLPINVFPTYLIVVSKNRDFYALIGQVTNIMQNINLLCEKLKEANDLVLLKEKNNKQPYNNNSSTIKNNNSITNNNNNKNNLQNNKINNNVIKNDIINNNIKNNNNNKINNNIINNNNKNINNINNNINKIEPSNNNNINSNNSKKEYIPNYADYEFEDDFIPATPVRQNTITGLTDGEVLAMQDSEMKQLEKIAEDKKKEEERIAKEKLMEENKINKKIKEEKDEIERNKELLPEEPKDDDPNKCIILFRYPDGETNKQRKFLKTDKISLLYIFIKTLGREIYTEDENQHFSIIQTFPFKNFDDKQETTLEEEGMFPNAVLQIQENE